MERKTKKENFNRYKIIRDCGMYYLTQSAAGYKECFSKSDNRKRYKIIDEYIYLLKNNGEEEDYEVEEE